MTKTMPHKPLLFFGAIVGGTVSVATLAEFFQHWNPILQGFIYISTLLIMWYSALHKKKVDRKDRDDTL